MRKNTLHCLYNRAHLVPNPNTHLVTSKWSSSHYFSHIPLLGVLKNCFKKEKKTTPRFRTPLPPTHMGKNREHGTPWIQEKNREQKKRLVWSSASWSGFPAASAAAIHRWVPSAFPPPFHGASPLPAHISRDSGWVRGGMDGRSKGSGD